MRAGMSVNYQAGWMSDPIIARIVRVIPPSENFIGRAFGGSMPVYVIAIPGDNLPLATSPDTVWSV